eukprot:3727193-Lingulodinium_polyedra.AAC.1
MTGPMVFSAAAVEKLVARVKAQSKEDLKTWFGVNVHSDNLTQVEKEVKRICKSIRWPRPIRLDPQLVPEERRNYACQHGAS